MEDDLLRRAVALKYEEGAGCGATGGSGGDRGK